MSSAPNVDDGRDDLPDDSGSPYREQTPEEYARAQLTNYLVQKGIEPDYARRHVEERVTAFTSVLLSDGRRHLLVKYEDRLWPTYSRGIENPHNQKFADELWLEADEVMQVRRQAEQRKRIGEAI